jgi:mRNA interferase MazF
VVSKWELYYCDLNPSTGSEQKGIRPVLIISSDVINHHLEVFTALPLSSLKPGTRVYPSEVLLPMSLTGLPKDSIAMVQQITTLSQQRLVNKAGTLGDEQARKKIEEALRYYFEL